MEFPRFHFCESVTSNLLFLAQKQRKHLLYATLEYTISLNCAVTVWYSNLTQAVNKHIKLAPVKCSDMQFKSTLLSAFGRDFQICKPSVIISNLCKEIGSKSSFSQSKGRYNDLDS